MQHQPHSPGPSCAAAGLQPTVATRHTSQTLCCSSPGVTTPYSSGPGKLGWSAGSKPVLQSANPKVREANPKRSASDVAQRNDATAQASRATWLRTKPLRNTTRPRLALRSSNTACKYTLQRSYAGRVFSQEKHGLQCTRVHCSERPRDRALMSDSTLQMH